MPDQREQSPYLHLPSHHYLLQLRKKQKQRGRKATFSLCSIDSKPSLQKICPSHHPRKVNSIHSLEVRHEQHPSSTARKPMSGRVIVGRTKTLEPYGYSQKQQEVSNRVRTIKGIFHGQNSRSNRRSGSQESVLQSLKVPSPCRPIYLFKENKPSNLDHYIRNHANAHSKVLMIKKGKSKSILNAISRGDNASYFPRGTSSIEVPAYTIQTSYSKEPSYCKKGSDRQTSKENQEGSSCMKSMKMTMDYLECSSIEKVNDSSFMSDVGRQELMGRLQNRNSTREQKEGEGRGQREEECRVDTLERGKKKFKLSNKKIKQIFPCDFFQG